MAPKSDRSTSHVPPNGKSAPTTQDAEGNPERGFRSLFHKFHHSHSGKDKDREGRNSPLSHPDQHSDGESATKVVPIVAVSTVPSSQPKQAVKNSGEERRLAAEKQLQEAGITLRKAMAKVSGKLEVNISEPIGLQHLNHVEDVAATATNIEITIDGIIDARALRASSDSREVWKDCASTWFKALYPYIKIGLKQVNVSPPEFQILFWG
jgi:hypothetical protein